MIDYVKQVEATVKATVIHSSTSYSWFGRLSPQLSPSIKRAVLPETARHYLTFNLQVQLYQDFYCQGLAVPTQETVRDIPIVGGTTPYMMELSAANCGKGYWEDGWEVIAIRKNQVNIRRDGLSLWARCKDCLGPEASELTHGMRVKLRLPKEFLGLSPGFYMALSDAELDQESANSLLRFYWNITPEYAVDLVRSSTLMLNRSQSPFRLKVLKDPSRFTRCDAAVLYVRKCDYDGVRTILEWIYPRLARGLAQRSPAFAKPLATGVSLAENPGFEESFGQHRCKLLAEGLVSAFEQGKKTINQRLQVVVDRFEQEGISLQAPFLNPGSNDSYRFRPRLSRAVQRPGGSSTREGVQHDTKVFLNAANQIGRRLQREAVWYESRCNWVGAVPIEHGPADIIAETQYAALGPPLYDGSSGVALFLGELYANTCEVETRRTALGAIRHSFSRLDSIRPSNRLGLYTGWLGIAFAAARLGILLDEEALLTHAADLILRCKQELHNKREFDLLSGNAGAISSLLVLRDILKDDGLLDFAVQLGDELLEAADQSNDGYSWKSLEFRSTRNLTGFSHGPAGIGYALLELFHSTGESKFLKGATKAFDYERHWFDQDEGNWPDFREGSKRSRRGRRTLSFVTYWCHGAPGIALSRLRAYEILGDETCKAEAATAVNTTITAIQTALDSGAGNFSLCHGLAGNAEALLYGSQLLAQDLPNAESTALKVAMTGVKRYAEHAHQWPCGAGRGETPNLMLGLAGIGYFYLRLHNERTPSILILKREGLNQSAQSSERQIS